MSNKTSLQEAIILFEKHYRVKDKELYEQIKTELLTKEKNDIIDANYRGQLYSIVEKQASVLESENYFLKIFNQ